MCIASKRLCETAKSWMPIVLSCPIGGDGTCKHVVALLLTWLEHPELFRDFEDMGVALEQRSREELIVLIKQMLKQSPDLEALLEIPLPKSKGTRVLNAETIRKQIRSAFQQSGYRWGSEGLIASAIDSVLDLGEDYVATRAWRVLSARRTRGMNIFANYLRIIARSAPCAKNCKKRS